MFVDSRKGNIKEEYHFR
jgi:serine/threonine protein kinase